MLRACVNKVHVSVPYHRKCEPDVWQYLVIPGDRFLKMLLHMFDDAEPTVRVRTAWI